MMDEDHLNISSAKTLLDIGSGCGKLVHQCFDSYDLDKVIGVEISALRYSRSFEASKAYVACVNKHSKHYYAVLREMTNGIPGHRVEFHRLQHKGGNPYVRTSVLEIYNCNIGLLGGIIAEASPEVVIMDVMHKTLSKEITGVLTSLPFGARIATFERIDERWPRFFRFPFLQTNIGEGYRTTWSEDHKFYMWRKTRIPFTLIRPSRVKTSAKSFITVPEEPPRSRPRTRTRRQRKTPSTSVA
uniref:DOT1 domain-containing protein n=2 Tax=Lotharella globosa TaxID=91324 RepID=A0A7S4DPE1_9EUKA|mmetsp:Transcript_23261/g.45357  ORF Transcript_23261/g.45357 Transcript_23261/m.45357 type:complete len:243 (+) Transcript_23261:678-1406(+)